MKKDALKTPWNDKHSSCRWMYIYKQMNVRIQYRAIHLHRTVTQLSLIVKYQLCEEDSLSLIIELLTRNIWRTKSWSDKRK